MGETSVLLKVLESQRRHVLGIVDDLSEEQLRRAVLPSGWHCLGMVKHLALSDEHYWFRCGVAGESTDFFFGPSFADGAEWRVGPNESSEDIFNLYRDEIARANAIIESTALDAPPKQRDDWWGANDFLDLRTILLHVIAETACHAGHLDAAVELLSGRQWIVQ